jgi:predicted RNA-binding Zn ribbon-like protein
MITEVSTPSERLELVRGFVNTFEAETGVDELRTREGLTGWLASRGLVPGAVPASRADVARARELREALRDLLVANAGGPSPAAAWETIDRQARRSRVGLRFDERGGALRPEAAGVDGALGELVAAVAAAMADGSWARLKACLADDCRWAFVDRSRNGSRRWCDMRVCGNREKARAFRARHGIPRAG